MFNKYVDGNGDNFYIVSAVIEKYRILFGLIPVTEVVYLCRPSLESFYYLTSHADYASRFYETGITDLRTALEQVIKARISDMNHKKYKKINDAG